MNPSPPSESRLGVMTTTQRVVLILIVFAAFGLRIGYLVYAQNTPGYAWEDPDRYMFHARRLAGNSGWHWSFSAVTHVINGQRHALPPLYPVFLSVFALFPGFPLTAQLAQIVLGGLSTLLIFALGRRIHSPTAGLIAAGAYAVWAPNILNVWSTSQETLYIPLILLSFVLLLRAIDTDGLPAAFAIAGVVFGAAALTRSMPLFFIIPAACLHVGLAAHRARAAVQGAALLAGFLVLVVPYSIGLSRHFGQLTLVDTHGSIHLGARPGQRAPGVLETGRQLWRAFAAQPAQYTAGILTPARSLLHVNGGRQLQIYVVARDKLRAVLWKTLVHAGTDALLVVGSISAAVGAVLCRQPRLAAFAILWTLLNVAIASVGGFSGARLRVPFEPFLFILAAVVFAGGWRRPGVVAISGALLVAGIVGFAVVPQVPISLRAWPDYGVQWPSIFDRRSGQIAGSAGLNVPAYEGVAAFGATLTGSAAQPLEVRAGGVHVRTVQLQPGERVPIRALWPARGLAFIELNVMPADPAATIRVDVGDR